MVASSSSSSSQWISSSDFSRARSACSVSDCELTDTYSPAAIDIAPATCAASPESTTVLCGEPAAATPTRTLATETMPSLAPSTAARSQPLRWTQCSSAWIEGDSSDKVASVDRQHGASDVARERRAEKQRRGCDIGGRTPPPKWHAGNQLGIACRIRARRLGHGRFDPAGCEYVDANLVLGE